MILTSVYVCNRFVVLETFHQVTSMCSMMLRYRKYAS